MANPIGVDDDEEERYNARQAELLRVGMALCLCVLRYGKAQVTCACCQGSGTEYCCDNAGNRSNAYHDVRWTERPCDGCGRPYQGPTPYCSFECAFVEP